MSQLREHELHLYPTEPIYYNSCCIICLKPAKKRCSNCKSLAYCSKIHQQQDWRIHRKLCKAIADTNKKIPFAVSSYEDYSTYRLGLRLAWKIILKRDLHSWENPIWMFPRVCEVCFTKNGLSDCENCLSVCYCSEDHRQVDWERHGRYCEELKLGLRINRFLLNAFEDDKVTNKLPVPTYTLNIRNDLEELPLTGEDFLKDTRTKIAVDDDNKMIEILRKEALNPILIMIYGLEKAGLIEKRQSSKRLLNVHVVGAWQNEALTNWPLCADFLQHWVRGIQRVNFIFIGPDVEMGPPLELENSECGECVKNGCSFRLEGHKKFYHSVVGDVEHPDLVVLFNPGFHENAGDESKGTWKPSIGSLFRKKGVPVIVTAYSKEEMRLDLEQVEAVVNRGELEFLMRNEANPFRGRKPLRDWLNRERPFYYVDDRISVIRRV